jgi:hypothetical protein
LTGSFGSPVDCHAGLRLITRLRDPTIDGDRRDIFFFLDNDD